MQPDSTIRGAARALLATIVAATVATTSLAACGETGILVDQETVDLGTESEKATTWVPTAQEPIRVELEVPATVRHGDEVQVRVRVHNGSDRPMGIGFAQRRGFDLLLARAEGRADSSAVWSPPRYFSATRDLTVTDPVPPGRDTVFTVIWPVVDDAGQKVPPGDYRIRATVAAELVSRRQLWSEWTPIRVAP